MRIVSLFIFSGESDTQQKFLDCPLYVHSTIFHINFLIVTDTTRRLIPFSFLSCYYYIIILSGVRVDDCHDSRKFFTRRHEIS